MHLEIVEFEMCAESICYIVQLVHEHKNYGTSSYSNYLSNQLAMQGLGSHKIKLKKESIIDNFMHHLIHT
jgi:hypothetical protein